MENLDKLVNELRTYSNETQWIEFKHNNYNPHMIGQDMQIPFSSMSPEDKLWACYLHACIKYIQGEKLTNSSLRERFGLKESSSGSISRLIRDAVDLHLIKPFDPDTAPRYMSYIPNWD